MRIERATFTEYGLEIVVDGRTLRVYDLKYTILEMGYAVYLLAEDDDEWVRANGNTIPGDDEDGRNELTGCDDMLVTADPILVALALEAWWHANGTRQPVGVSVPIPLFAEAVAIVRHRRILNDFSRKFAGTVPGLDVGSS